jgi:hypothetical protein
MTAYLIFHMALHGLACIAWLTSKPGVPRKAHTPGEIAFGAALSAALLTATVGVLWSGL